MTHEYQEFSKDKTDSLEASAGSKLLQTSLFTPQLPIPVGSRPVLSFRHSSAPQRLSGQSPLQLAGLLSPAPPGSPGSLDPRLLRSSAAPQPPSSLAGLLSPAPPAPSPLGSSVAPPPPRSSPPLLRLTSSEIRPPVGGGSSPGQLPLRLLAPRASAAQGLSRFLQLPLRSPPPPPATGGAAGAPPPQLPRRSQPPRPSENLKWKRRWLI